MEEDQYTVSQMMTASIAKALSHPARVAIIEKLIASQTCVCNELVDMLPLAQATVSQHLKVLKEANLIKGEISGASGCYCLDGRGWELAAVRLQDLMANAQISAGVCCGTAKEPRESGEAACC